VMEGKLMLEWYMTFTNAAVVGSLIT
jgi:hypothetical protein